MSDRFTVEQQNAFLDMIGAAPHIRVGRLVWRVFGSLSGVAELSAATIVGLGVNTNADVPVWAYTSNPRTLVDVHAPDWFATPEEAQAHAEDENNKDQSK